MLQSRWVTNFKVIEQKDGARVRIVIKDVAQTKAKSSGVSSPTPSTEGLKLCLALGAKFAMHLISLYVSAFMHTPLSSKGKYMVKLPLSVTWSDDHSPMHLELRRVLNGLRPASLEWLNYVTKIVFPMNLTADPREPCFPSEPAGMIVVYVDDVLCFGFDAMFGIKIHHLLNKVVPTKIIGKIDMKRGGQLKFVGREFSFSE